MKAYLLLILISFSITYSKFLDCGENTIENCKNCGVGNLSDSCSECEDNYFLFYGNLTCLPCNSSFYGNPGCLGKCKKKLYEGESFDLNCTSGCSEGYYLKDGKCRKCYSNCKSCFFNETNRKVQK